MTWPSAQDIDLGFASWQDLADWLSGGWFCLLTGTEPGSVFHGSDGLVVLEQPGALRARHRRGLHRSGFRPCAGEAIVAWVWRSGDERRRPRHERCDERAIHLLRDVFRASPHEVGVLLPPDCRTPALDAWGASG